MNKIFKNTFFYQFLIALIGTIFSFTSVVFDFTNYYNNCGTIFISNSATIPHPFATPCFYGAFAFLTALILSYLILFKQKKSQKYLVSLAAFGSAFAWGNMFLEFNKFFAAKGSPYTGCSGATVTNPFLTACFGGSVIFLILFIFSFRNKKTL